MVKIGLQIKARLENVTKIRAEGDDFRWYMKLKCMSCGEEPDHLVYFSAEDSHDLKGGRGHASMVLKCKLCGRENSISVLPETAATYDLDDDSKFKTIVAFDCRGLEPTTFEPRNGWSAESSESGKPFEDIDLSEKEWVDYDEKSNLSVGIFDVESQFIKLK